MPVSAHELALAVSINVDNLPRQHDPLVFEQQVKIIQATLEEIIRLT